MVVFHNPFIYAFQPESLTVQVSGSCCCCFGHKDPWQSHLLSKHGQLGVAFYCLCQTGGKRVEGFVHLCVDLHWGRIGVLNWGIKKRTYSIICEVDKAKGDCSLICCWERKVINTFGMLHLVLKGDGAPPFPRQVPVMLWVWGAVSGEVIQQHHICAYSGNKTKRSLFYMTLLVIFICILAWKGEPC